MWLELLLVSILLVETLWGWRESCGWPAPGEQVNIEGLGQSTPWILRLTEKFCIFSSEFELQTTIALIIKPKIYIGIHVNCKLHSWLIELCYICRLQPSLYANHLCTLNLTQAAPVACDLFWDIFAAEKIDYKTGSYAWSYCFGLINFSS